jgi:hypothetical protein
VKILFEILVSIFLHPVAMVLMWVNLAARTDLTSERKFLWFVLSLLWGLGPVLYMLIDNGTLW